MFSTQLPPRSIWTPPATDGSAGSAVLVCGIRSWRSWRSARCITGPKCAVSHPRAGFPMCLAGESPGTQRSSLLGCQRPRPAWPRGYHCPALEAGEGLAGRSCAEHHQWIPSQLRAADYRGGEVLGSQFPRPAGDG
eukprot:s588_g8.t1